MNIIEQIEADYRAMKGYGIQFSIEPEAYECDIPDDRLIFGDNTTDMQCGTLYNWQPILIDGNSVGFLQEKQSGKLFDPMTITFIYILADCMEQELWDEMLSKHNDNPHLCDAGETLELRFATLQQFVDYLRSLNNIPKSVTKC